jgi:hypothetical protein
MRFLTPLVAKAQALKAYLPSGPALRKFFIIAGFVACTAAAFWYGRQGAQVTATTPDPKPLLRGSLGVGSLPEGYSGRVVAHIHGQPIYREELGEYLIARFGADRVEFLVNRRIVEKECTGKGIVVSDAEVAAQLDADIKALGPLMTESEFTNNILKRFNKTLYEWKEDVIRPKLQLSSCAGRWSR